MKRGCPSRYYRILIRNTLLLLLLMSPRAAAEEQPEPQVVEQPPAEALEYTVTAAPIVDDVHVSPFADQQVEVTAEQWEMLGAHDITGALVRVPGVVISRYNMVGNYGGGEGAAVYIRGHGAARPGAELSTLIDGVPRFVGVWTHPLMDMMPIDAAGALTVYKNPQPVLLGNMAFAAVDMKPRRITDEGWSARVHTLGGSHNTFGVAAQAGLRRDDTSSTVTTAHRRSDGHRTNADGETTEFSTRVSHQLNAQLSTSVYFLHTEGAANDPGPVGASLPIVERFATENDFAIVTLNAKNRHYRAYAKLYVDDGHIDWRQWHEPPPPPFPAQQLNTITDYQNYGLRTRISSQPWQSGELVGGFDYDIYGGQVDEVFASGGTTSYDEINFRNTAPYMLVRHTFDAADWDVTPSAGLRYTDTRYFGGQTSGRAGLRAVRGDTTLHAHYTRGFNLAGVYAAIFAAKWSLADAWQDLKPEVIDHVEIGIVQEWDDRLELALTGFYDDVKDALRLDPPPDPAITNIGHYRTQGIEAQLKWKLLEKTDLVVGATWNDGERDGGGEVPFLPEWTGVVGANHQWKDWRFSVTGSYIGERLYTGTRFEGAGVQLDDYFLVSARVGYRIAPDRARWRCEFYIAGDNLTDTDYVYRPDYPMPGATALGGVDIRF